ncbi:MAG: PUR family DNA/RNA-binding protein [bacterium]|nr:PUR family DNA/RNA-binding protein [bacterium]
MNNKQKNKDIYSDKIRLGRRTYFFDVKENATGERYLVITESKQNKDLGFRRDRIVVFSEHIEEFSTLFCELKNLMQFVS